MPEICSESNVKFFKNKDCFTHCFIPMFTQIIDIGTPQVFVKRIRVLSYKIDFIGFIYFKFCQR